MDPLETMRKGRKRASSPRLAAPRRSGPGGAARCGGAPRSLVVFTSRPYGTWGAATALVPSEGALATELGAVGCVAVDGVTGTVAGTVPFTVFFCFVDDVAFGGRADRLAGYRMRIKDNC